MEIVLATRNKKKVEEIRRMFMGTGITFLDLNDFPDSPDVEENGATFTENADIKACAIARHTRRHALADDSGLVVDVLDGAPGVHSARYAGVGASDRQNLNLLLDNLKNHGGADRKARFECVLSLSDPQGQVAHFSGSVSGFIIDASRGDNGFGYDPVFVPEGHRQTFAEMSPREKDRLSHRGQALALLERSLTRSPPSS
ncbi:MAG: XTP/dITP diphosphatase [Magnetococcales bacterium]|nr:XTP/dITP diphosphatase [Magnetococcales bacterium]